ncbi:unnamed protein product [Caenorhabditis brenneri]
MSCSQEAKNLSFYSPEMNAELETIFTPEQELERDLAFLDSTIGRFLTNDFEMAGEESKEFDSLFESSEEFEALMTDTGFVEYLLPLQQLDDESFDEFDSVSDSEGEDEASKKDGENGSDNKKKVAPNFSVYTKAEIQEMVRVQFEKRVMEIKEKKEEKMNGEVFKRHFFEYRRFLARPRHLLISKDIIRRKVLDFALLRFNLCESDAVSDAWAFVFTNYMEEMGPDLLFLSECYTAVNGMLDAFERFTFFGI